MGDLLSARERRYAQLCLPIWGDKGKTLRGPGSPDLEGTVPPATRPRGFTGLLGRARAQWEEEGTRPLTPKNPASFQGSGVLGALRQVPGHRASAGQGSPDPLLPKQPPPKDTKTAFTVAAAGPLPPAWARSPRPSECGAGRGTGACSSAKQSRAASSLRPRRAHSTLTEAQPWQPQMPRPGGPTGVPRPFGYQGCPGTGLIRSC